MSTIHQNPDREQLHGDRIGYDARYPSVLDLKIRSKKRIPNFAFDYVDGAIDEERGKQRNRESFHEIILTPRYLTDVSTTDISAELFGRRYAMAFGVPPIGLGNMMWPGAEAALADQAQRSNIPYVLSTFSTTSMEEIAAIAPDVCWFQLYVPKKRAVMKELIARVKESGFNALIVTLDIPVGAKRNRELKNGLKLPFSFTPNIVWQCLTHPRWALASLRHGMPDFVNVLRYKEGPNEALGQFISNFTMTGDYARANQGNSHLVGGAADPQRGPVRTKYPGCDWAGCRRHCHFESRWQTTGCCTHLGGDTAQSVVQHQEQDNRDDRQWHTDGNGCGAQQGTGCTVHVFRSFLFLRCWGNGQAGAKPGG